MLIDEICERYHLKMDPNKILCVYYTDLNKNGAVVITKDRKKFRMISQ